MPYLLRSGDVQGTPSIPLYLYIVPAGAIPPVSLPGLIEWFRIAADRAPRVVFQSQEIRSF